jgi:hypothetical protein
MVMLKDNFLNIEKTIPSDSELKTLLAGRPGRSLFFPSLMCAMFIL